MGEGGRSAGSPDANLPDPLRRRLRAPEDEVWAYSHIPHAEEGEARLDERRARSIML